MVPTARMSTLGSRWRTSQRTTEVSRYLWKCLEIIILVESNEEVKPTVRPETAPAVNFSHRQEEEDEGEKRPRSEQS